MDEFELIDALLAELGDAARGPLVSVGPGDDCAVTRVPAGHELVSTIDSLVDGVHVPTDASAELVGCRAMGIAVSDLAAMGAEPSFCIIALTLPRGDHEWVTRFARGVGRMARELACPVVGGNLASGPLNVTVSAHGHVPAGAAILRSGARPGDLVCVSGSLGSAAVALRHPRLRSVESAGELLEIGPGHRDYPLRRYFLPEPRLRLGMALRGIASAAVDVSDGLIADLGHICERSAVGARLDSERIPRGPECGLDEALSAGDDYELCFTVPAPRRTQLETVMGESIVPISVIGEIVSVRGIELRQGAERRSMRGGYQHFQ